MSTGVGAPVGGVEDDDGAWCGLLSWSDAGHCENDGEAGSEMSDGEGQGRWVDCKGFCFEQNKQRQKQNAGISPLRCAMRLSNSGRDDDSFFECGRKTVRAWRE
jgi:hypothetical protein